MSPASLVFDVPRVGYVNQCGQLLSNRFDDRGWTMAQQVAHWRSETVAELGGATLLSVLGNGHDADLGGCWQYVKAYATDAKIEPLVACQRVLKRTCDSVALVLDTAEQLQTTEPVPTA